MIRIRNLLFCIALSTVFILAFLTCDQESTREVASDDGHTKQQQSDDDDSAAAPNLSGQATLGHVSPPFDAAAVVRRIGLAFRPDGAGFLSLADTFSAEVEGDGSIALTPFHHPDGPEAEMIAGAPFLLRTASLTRSETAYDVDVLAVEATDNGGLLFDRGAAVEWLENRGDALEQGWTFDTPPAGRGDLAVFVEATGLPFTEATDTGLHFADPDTGLGFCYSHAVWLDADGRETPVPALRLGGQIVLVVSAETLETSTYPAVLDPIIGPEFGSDNPLYVPARNRQSAPSIAFDGENYLAVWEDRRNSSTNTESDIYGVIIEPSGELIETAGIRIADDAGSQVAPTVAFNGTHYFVSWANDGGTVHGARITTAGVVLDSEGIPLSDATTVSVSTATASDDNGWLVAWIDKTSGMIYYNLVSATGTVSTPGGYALLTATGDLAGAAVRYNGDVYLLVYASNHGGANYDLYGAVITTAGVAQATFDISTAGGDQRAPAVAAGPDQFLVTWLDTRSGVNLYGAMIDNSGAVTAADIVISNAISNQQSSAAAFDGANYLVVWDDFRSLGNFDIYGARVDTTGAVLDPAGVVVSVYSNNQYEPDIAFDGVNFMVVWHDYRGGVYPDIYGARVDTAGGVLDPDGIPVSVHANEQAWVDVALDGAEYLLVWEDQRDGVNWDIFGTRIDANGTILDLDGIAISTAAGRQERPAVTYGGGRFFVAWSDYRDSQWDIYGTRVSTAGVVEDDAAEGIAISKPTNTQSRPDVAYGGGYFLTVWQDNRGGVYDIYGARVAAATGALADAGGIAISTAINEQTNPAVAFNGTRFLAVWEDTRGGAYDVYASRVQTTGAVQDAAGLAVSTAAADQEKPVVASDGATWLVAWQDERNSGTTGVDIYGARVADNGTISDPSGIAICDTATDQLLPDVVYNGGYYLAVWQDLRNGADYDIYGNWLTSVGVVLESEDVTISDQALVNESAPAAASAADGVSLVAYYYTDRTTIYGGRRIFGRLVTYQTLGTECSDHAHCGTGYCVDGVCCNTLCGDSDPDDCQACSVEAGAAVDGACSTLGTSVECRPAEDVCDIAEYCNGVSVACPTDVYQPPVTQCRAAAGACDVAEYCTGASAVCPADLYAPASTACRAAAGVCDLTEYCSGNGPECPVDLFASISTPCRVAAGVCDATEYCSGDDSACPEDLVRPETVECRSVAGDCDAAEYCDGVGADCPADLFAPATVECRPVADVCDLAEFCTGAAANCPTDAFAQTGVECRPAVGDCDVAESCTGAAAACPADQYVPDGSDCEDDLFCNGTDACLSGVCVTHTGNPCEPNETCSEEVDQCLPSGDDDDVTPADDDDDDDNDNDDNDDNDDVTPIDDDTTSDDDDDNDNDVNDKGDDDDDDDDCCGC